MAVLAQSPTIENPAPDASPPDGIYTPFTNRLIYQLIGSDYQAIVALTNQIRDGTPLPAGEIMTIYEQAKVARIGEASRPLRAFAQDPARADEFPESAAYFGSATFLDDPVADAIAGVRSAEGHTMEQRRQAIQKGMQRILYYWVIRYVDQAGDTLNPGLVDEAWAIYVGAEVEGRYPNSLANTVVSRESNFGRPGTIDVPLRQALSRAQRAAADKDAAAYAAAARQVYSRFHTFSYLGTVRHLQEPVESVGKGDLTKAAVQLVEGISDDRTIQPIVARADPAANARLESYFAARPGDLTVQMRNDALDALNGVAAALLLEPADIVTPAMLD